MNTVKRITLTFCVILFAASARAKLVERKCLRKLLNIAGNMATSGTFFDWSEDILEKFPAESVPILKRSCVSEDDKLHSFRLVMRGYDD